MGLVTIAHGRHDHLRLQHQSLARAARRPDVYVVAAMGDPAIGPVEVDGLVREVVGVEVGAHLPLAAARNAGVAAALAGGAEVVVLLDVDCLAGPELVAAYDEAVTAAPGVVWSGPVTYLQPAPTGGYRLDDLGDLDAPHPARPDLAPGQARTGAAPELFWSLSFALSAQAWLRTGGFCEDYLGYGGEDTDFAQVALGHDLELGWLGAARAYHQHHPVERPPVRHLDDILRNAHVYRRRWGDWPMLGWLEAFERDGLVRRDGESWVRACAGPESVSNRPQPPGPDQHGSPPAPSDPR